MSIEHTSLYFVLRTSIILGKLPPLKSNMAK